MAGTVNPFSSCPAVRRANAVGVILLSVLGNATWHLIAAELVTVTWVTVVLVGAVPPVVLGLVAHLAVLRTQDDEVVLQPVPVTREYGPETAGAVPGAASSSWTQRRYATGDDLLAAARIADAAHRDRYGRPITRDQLRRELRVGGQRATEVLRKLRDERA